MKFPFAHVPVLACAASVGLLLAGLQAPAADMPTAPGNHRLTLRQALDLALERNLQLSLSYEQVEQARSTLLETRAALGPTVTLTGSQSNQTTNLIAQGFPKAALALFPALDGPFNSFDARLNFSMAVFNRTRDHLANASARQVAEAEHQKRAVEDQILTATALGYIAAQQQVATLQAAQSTLALSKELLVQARDQQSAGVATGVDVARAETRVAQDQYALTQASNGLAEAVLRLKRVLGLPSADVLELATPLDYQEARPPGTADAVALAEQNRQELQVLDERVGAAEENLDAARDESLPVVTVGAGIGPSGATPIQQDYLTRSVGIGVSVPLYTGGVLEAHRDRASSLLRAARLSREDARRQVEEDVHLALLALTTSSDQVVAARTGLELGERLLRLARDRFASGVADNLEVLDALNSTTVARSRLIDAIAAHSAALANFDAAVGQARSFGLSEPDPGKNPT